MRIVKIYVFRSLVNKNTLRNLPLHTHLLAYIYRHYYCSSALNILNTYNYSFPEMMYSFIKKYNDRISRKQQLATKVQHMQELLFNI